jgi:hypothetical protein
MWMSWERVFRIVFLMIRNRMDGVSRGDFETILGESAWESGGGAESASVPDSLCNIYLGYNFFFISFQYLANITIK